MHLTSVKKIVENSTDASDAHEGKSRLQGEGAFF